MKKVKNIVLKEEHVDASASSTIKHVNKESEGNRSGGDSGSGSESGSGSGSEDDWGGIQIQPGSFETTIGHSTISTRILISWTGGSVTGNPITSRLSIRILETTCNFPIHDSDDPTIEGLNWRQGYVAQFYAVFCWGEYELDEYGQIRRDENGNPIIIRKNEGVLKRCECPVIEINETSGNNLP